MIAYLRSILRPLLTVKNTGTYFIALRASYESRVAWLSIEARQHFSSLQGEAYQRAARFSSPRRTNRDGLDGGCEVRIRLDLCILE